MIGLRANEAIASPCEQALRSTPVSALCPIKTLLLCHYSPFICYCFFCYHLNHIMCKAICADRVNGIWQKMY